MSNNIQEYHHLLNRKIRLYRSFFLVTAAVLAGVLLYSPLTALMAKIETKLNQESEAERLPHFKEIEALMKNLHYSALEMFAREKTSLSIDFDAGFWTLKNIHRYDESGKLILDKAAVDKKGLAGACGELAFYTHEQIKPFFSQDYSISYVRVAQSGFFLTPDATHIILKITQKRASSFFSPAVYFLDPSFDRYGTVDQFEDYLFYDELETIPYLQARDTNISMTVGKTIPLWIEDNYLLSFFVNKVNGKFDKGNFLIALVLTKQYRYQSRFLISYYLQNGVRGTMENELLINEILDKERVEIIKKKMLQMLEQNQ